MILKKAFVFTRLGTVKETSTNFYWTDIIIERNQKKRRKKMHISIESFPCIHTMRLFALYDLERRRVFLLIE